MFGWFLVVKYPSTPLIFLDFAGFPEAFSALPTFKRRWPLAQASVRAQVAHPYVDGEGKSGGWSFYYSCYCLTYYYCLLHPSYYSLLLFFCDIMITWLVVLTILTNIRQWEGLSHILWKRKAMFQTTSHSLWLLCSCLKIDKTWFLADLSLFFHKKRLGSVGISESLAPDVPVSMWKNNNPVLVGGIPTPLKNMKVSWGYYSQYMEK